MRYGYRRSYSYYGFAPYVPVATRRARAAKELDSMLEKGQHAEPVVINGRKIAESFWGKAWCEHLEGFSDFENRLPRGRAYLRNGSVCHLGISKGEITAKVCGSELYTVEIGIETLAAPKWAAIKRKTGGHIGSLIELLGGRLSDQVMNIVTDRKQGLFPLSGEMKFSCSCPDYAVMCKHVAAVLYGVGARLDSKPELLFLLRGVDHEELIAADTEQAVVRATSGGKSKRLKSEALADVFGIELDGVAALPAAKPKKKAAAGKPAAKLAAKSAPRRPKQPVEAEVPASAAASRSRGKGGEPKATKAAAKAKKPPKKVLASRATAGKKTAKKKARRS